MADLQKFKKDFILFAEAGFIAVNQTDEDAAVKLFKAANMLDEKNLLPKIGLGYLHLCKLELEEAAKAFQEALAVNPQDELANTLLGLVGALAQKGGMKGEKILEKAAKSNTDPLNKELAETSLNFINRFVKKPGPIQPAPRKK